MIGYWYHIVVCLSVYLSVTPCIVALGVGVQGYKLYQRVPSRYVPICPFRSFSNETQRTKRIEENASVSFLKQKIGEKL